MHVHLHILHIQELHFTSSFHGNLTHDLRLAIDSTNLNIPQCEHYWKHSL